MSPESPDYLAYMLRLWRVPRDGETYWRAEVECPHTGHRTTFASLEALIAFIEEQTCVKSQRGPGPTALQPDVKW